MPVLWNGLRRIQMVRLGVGLEFGEWVMGWLVGSVFFVVVVPSGVEV